jgi:hypothetical protein
MYDFGFKQVGEVEALIRVELMNRGFAIHSLSHLGTAPQCNLSIEQVENHRSAARGKGILVENKERVCK